MFEDVIVGGLETRTVLEAYQRYVFHYRKKNGQPLGFNAQHDRLVPLRVWFRWMARNHHILHSSQPVIVSHCGVTFAEQSKHPSTDRLDDDTIRRIASARGVLALHFLNGYVQARRRAHATVEDLVDEIDHIKKVAGIDAIALGPDYSPMQGWRWIEGGETYVGMPNVVREMVFRGYTDEEIEKVLGGNLVRLYSAVWKQ